MHGSDELSLCGVVRHTAAMHRAGMPYKTAMQYAQQLRRKDDSRGSIAFVPIECPGAISGQDAQVHGTITPRRGGSQFLDCPVGIWPCEGRYELTVATATLDDLGEALIWTAAQMLETALEPEAQLGKIRTLDTSIPGGAKAIV